MATNDCGMPKKVCVAGEQPEGQSFCVDPGDCTTKRIVRLVTLDADCAVLSSRYAEADVLGNLIVPIVPYAGPINRVSCAVQRVQVVDSCDSSFPPSPLPQVPAALCDGTTQTVEVTQTIQTVPHKDFVQKVEFCTPPTAFKIEFSETKLYSASSELGLFRIREYDEDTGVWTLRYENLDGTPFTGTLPADLTAVTAQVNITRTAVLGCANNVPYYMRETARFDAETGALESELVDWVDSAGVVTPTAPAGFVLGACPEPCEFSAPVGVVGSWG